MFRYLRLKQEPKIISPLPGSLSGEQLASDFTYPIQLLQLNNLPENTRRRIYRGLIPPELLVRFKIDPLTWLGVDSAELVTLQALPETSLVRVSVRPTAEAQDDFFHLEISDNQYGSIELNFIILSDPDSPRFDTDRDEQGNQTWFGTARRNLSEELRAAQAGLAPGQTRGGLGSSRLVFQQLEVFLSVLGHRSYFLEPLTYVSAWLFERLGFAYVRGHKLMDDIQREFQPGGVLNQSLDASSPFRQPEQWQTVRGRAWAIQDGILETINARWDKIRMIKHIGRHAGVMTFPDAIY